jgi:hypothetical protein
MAWFANHSELNVSGARSGHELDALLSAWATREGLAAGWADLVGDDPALLFAAGRVSYLWPEATVEGQTMEKQDQKPSRHVSDSGKRRESRNTTAIGYVNRHKQEVVRKTDLPGNDHGQRVYVLRCNACGHNYGANGSDIWLRRCPKHDRGAPGLAY